MNLTLPCALAVTVLLGGGAAQKPDSQQAAGEWQRDAEAWLVQPRGDEAREQVANALLEAGPAALRWLATKLRAAEPVGAGPDRQERRARLRALESLTAAVTLGFIDRAQETEMVYAGQYDDLRLLQPYSGNLYLNLLLDTPDWFAEQRRVLLIPALRDLYPSSPGPGELSDVREIAEHEDLEAWDLRLALFCALAQWGDRELIEAHLAELRERATDSDDEDRLGPIRELAGTHHLLRDYVTASGYYRELLRSAERIEVALSPSDYYNAACNMSLTGDLESSLEELERCVKLMRSGTVDSSLMLKRELFERDPEIANVRKTARFAALMAAGFPESNDKRK